jgi:hypothetical protein
MVQGVSASDADSLTLTGRLLHRNDPFFVLGKPRGTLATTSGRCLAPLEGELVTVPCSDPRAGRFDLTSGSVQLVVSGQTHCLSNKGATVGVSPCDDVSAAARFDLTGARWSTPERCIAPHEAQVGSAVSLFACRAVGDPSQAWQFDMQKDAMSGNVVARIRFEALDACLTRTSDPSFRLDVPTLQPCTEDEPRQAFQLLQSGIIGTSENLCLRADLPNGALYLDICGLADAFWLSGSLQTTDRQAVTARNGKFVAESADSSPDDEQIFDLYF